jgi:hypothetical protein
MMSETQQPSDESIREILNDISARLPNYGQLSARLVSEGYMSANQQSQLLGPLGPAALPLTRLTRFIPGIGLVTRILSLVGAVRFALTQMQPETANEHLEAVGLTREQVEADFLVTKYLAKRAGMVGSREVTRVAGEGARVAGKLAARGRQALRDWQAGMAEADEPEEPEKPDYSDRRYP